MQFGAGRGRDGVVLMVTLGTGIGSAVFHDGVLLPNTELGHLQMDGQDAEDVAAESVREADGLSWKQWSKRLNEYLQMLEGLLSPDLIVIGGGISKKSGKFIPHLDVQTEVVPAELLNEAGIVGAALAHAAASPTAHTD
jgi:polyphosphate glucokinase